MTPQTTPGFLKYPDTCRASFVSGHSSLAYLLFHSLINWSLCGWSWSGSLFFVAITHVHNNNDDDDEGFIKC